MKILKGGDPEKVAKVLTRQSWIGQVLKCHQCGCKFVLSAQDREKIHLEMGEIYDNEFDYAYFVACPECLTDVVVGEEHRSKEKLTDLGDFCVDVRKEAEHDKKVSSFREHMREYLPVLRELERAHRVRDIIDVTKEIKLSSGKPVKVRIWTEGDGGRYRRANFSLKNGHRVAGDIGGGRMTVKVDNLSGRLYDTSFRDLFELGAVCHFHLED